MASKYLTICTLSIFIVAISVFFADINVDTLFDKYVNQYVHQTQEKTFENIAPRKQQISWSDNNGIIKHKVERIRWGPHLAFAPHLIRLREPAILTNTMVSSWKAVKLWQKPSYLATHPNLALLHQVQKGPRNTFGFIDKNTGLAKLKIPGIDLKGHWDTIDMTSEEFFKQVQDPNDTDYYYWYGKVNGTLRDDVRPSRFLFLGAEDAEQFGLYMWLSSDDVRPPIHYDQDHNFFVHLSGTKRFVFYPPWEWKNMYPYPRIHPMWHKSQVSYDNPDLERVPNYRNATAYEAILHPGDIMYLPPYWWHHVHSMTASVSLASWSQSGSYRSLKDLYARKLEIDQVTNKEEKAALTKTYFDIMLERIYGKDRAIQFVKDVLSSRWEPIAHLLKSYDAPNVCNFSLKFSTEQFRNRLEADVSFAVEKFNNCQEESLDYEDVVAIRDLEIADYLEKIIEDTVGAENVYSFLKYCMNT